MAGGDLILSFIACPFKNPVALVQYFVLKSAMSHKWGSGRVTDSILLRVNLEYKDSGVCPIANPIVKSSSELAR